MTATTGPIAVLIGPPGAGKTTVAAAVAERLGVTARDTDRDVEQRAGRSVPTIFVNDGEPEFRRLEREAVLLALDEHDGVLAVGGGAVADPDVRRALAGRPVVFLDVRIADAARRLGLNRERPVLLGNPRAQWTALMDRRRPVYAELAAITVATDGLTVAQVVDAVLTGLTGLTGSAGLATPSQESA
jgi:shikimate kinase